MDARSVFPSWKGALDEAEPLSADGRSRASGDSLDAARLRSLLVDRPSGGVRRAPAVPLSNSAASRDASSGTTAAERPRGDHDLNPDFFDPAQPLTPAAVLVPIVERDDALSVLLTLRTDHLHDHAGQVAFPGGRVDAGDRSPEHCALRETHEEVGLPAEHIDLVGRLDTYVTRTGFEVTPVVGLVSAPYPVAPDSFEVAEVFEVPLEHFLVPENRQMESRFYEGRERFFYAFPYGRHYIWGATAGMLVNLVEIILDPARETKKG